MLEQETGRRVLNDTHGLMVYETEPKAMFAGAGNPDFIRGVPEDRFTRVVRAAFTDPEPLTPEERLAADLFGVSFFQDNADSRFLLLMIAYEALLDPPQRPQEAVQLVDSFIATARESLLEDSDKASLIGSLEWLRNESINRTGRRLAQQRLGDRMYADSEPADFFSHCYGLRSKLVHGSQPAPTRNEIGSAAAALEIMVGDLLAGSLLHQAPQLL